VNVKADLRRPFLRSGKLQLIRIHFDRGGPVDEIQAQQHGCHAVAPLDPSLEALQRAGFDAHAHAFADGRGQSHLQVRFQSEEDVLQLLLKDFLIEHIEEVGDMVALADSILLSGLELKKNITGEERLLEHDRLAAVLMRRHAARQRHRDAVPPAIRRKLFLPSRFGVGHEPTHFGHVANHLGAGP
jgi:hypothetical protein